MDLNRVAPSLDLSTGPKTFDGASFENWNNIERNARVKENVDTLCDRIWRTCYPGPLTPGSGSMTLTRSSSTWVSRTCYFCLSTSSFLKQMPVITIRSSKLSSDWFHLNCQRPAAERVAMETSVNWRWCDAELNWNFNLIDSSWHYPEYVSYVDVSVMRVELCGRVIGGHLVCDWRPCSKQTTTQTDTWQGRGASPIDRSTWAPAPCVSLIIAVAVNIDPFTSRSVDTAARAFVFEKKLPADVLMAFWRFHIHRLTWNFTWLFRATKMHFGQKLNFAERFGNELWILNDLRSGIFELSAAFATTLSAVKINCFA